MRRPTAVSKSGFQTVSHGSPLGRSSMVTEVPEPSARSVNEMNAEFKLAAAGGTPGDPRGVASGADSATTAAEVEDVLDDSANIRSELDGLARSRRKADAEAEADEKLAALKRRMGK